MTTLEEAQDFMEQSRLTPHVPGKNERLRSAATIFISDQRKNGNDGRIPRQAIEAAIRQDAGLSRQEMNDSLVETYDALAKLGMVPPRQINGNSNVR